MHKGFWWGVLREKGHLENLGADGNSIFEKDLQVVGLGGKDGLIWLRTGTRGGLL